MSGKYLQTSSAVPDCSKAVASSSASDGVYVIRPGLSDDRRTARTYCQRDSAGGPGWTVIQRRLDGRQSFSRGWDDYAAGFGDADGDYWLGNEYIHRLTSLRPFRLRVDMWDVDGRHWVAEYPAFRVASSDELYRLDLGRPRTDEHANAPGNHSRLHRPTTFRLLLLIYSFQFRSAFPPRCRDGF